MAKLKLDVKKAKDFATKRYEVIALGVAGVLAAVCLVSGVSKFLGASSPDGAIQADVKRLEQARANAQAPPQATAPTVPPSTWGSVLAAEAVLETKTPLFVDSPGTTQRSRPTILTVDAAPRSFQLDYLNRGVFHYVLKDDSDIVVFKGSDAAKADPVFLVGQKRMVVVSAVFPYHKQCEQYCKALRIDRIEDLFARGLAPTFEGLNVERRKIATKGGKDRVGDWEPVYAYNAAADHVEVSGGVARLLQTCIFENSQIDRHYDLIHGATVTPMPMLAGANPYYPQVNIAALQERLAPQPADPKAKGAGAKQVVPLGRPRQVLLPHPTDKERSAEVVPLKNLPQDVQEQIAGKLNWFSPYGTFAEEDSKGEPGKTPAPFKEGVKGGPKAPTALPVSPHSLVRFVDVDVDPGAKYQYRIQVRFANPNYKMPAKVLAHTGLARDKQLVSGWVETPPIAIPEEFHYYVVNQERGFANHLKGPKTIDVAPATFAPSLLADRLPFQVHRFVGYFQDSKDKNPHYVCEWLVAERLLVGRGEAIGREVDVELVQWNKDRSSYEIGTGSIGKVPKGKGTTGIPVDFRVAPQVVLLDFAGGKQQYRNAKGGDLFVEESAAEALVLMPDLSMTLRNSRNDMNDLGFDNENPAIGGHPDGQERRKRWEEWSARLKELREANTPKKK